MGGGAPAYQPYPPPAPALPPWPKPTFPGSEPSSGSGSAATALAAPPAPAGPAAFPARDWRSTLTPPVGPGPGTVYSGGKDVPEMTTAMPAGLETSGSLTGHILAQGQHDAPRTGWRTGRVVLIMVVVLLVLVGAGWGVAVLAGDAVTDLFNGLIED
jgi:hypothetical protein